MDDLMLDRRGPSTTRVVLWALAAASGASAYSLLEYWLLDVHVGAGLVAPSRATLAAPVWWFAWVPLAPWMARFVVARPVGRERWVRAARTYAAGALGFALLRGLIGAPVWLWAAGAPPARNYGPLSGLLRVVWWSVLRTPSGVVEFLVFATAYHAWSFGRIARDRQVAAARLGEALVRAELDALKARLEPHFLFNTLNSITAFVRSDAALAERLILRLSRVLRGILEVRDQQEIALTREVALAEEYLDIQRLRIGDRLSAAVEVPVDLGDALVPTLLLQPLVENAIQHGIAARPGRGRVRVSARSEGDRLVLEVRADQGDDPTVTVSPDADASASAGAPPGHRLGLATTRERLQQLYRNRQSLDLDVTASGSVVTVSLPLRRVAAGAGEYA